MDGIIESISEMQMWDNARCSLVTFYNYIEAWVIYIKKLYGSDNNGKNAFIDKVKSLPKFNRLQSGASINENFVNAYNRGSLTLRMMNVLPIGEHPEIAFSMNFWLPAHSYYAIHGVGSAFFMASTRNPPKTHSSFRASFSDIAQKYFPIPLCGVCIGGPETRDFLYPGLSTNADRVIKLHNLSNRKFADTDDFVGKSLQSTRLQIRDKLFEELRNKDVKPHCTRRNLTPEEKRTSCKGIPATSICDLIYRMGVRSNYDNPDMYLFASDSTDNAVNHYYNLLYLTEIIIAGLETLIERKVGRTEMAALKSKFE